MIGAFKTYRQLDTMDCGPTCLKMIAKYYGREYSLQKIREYCFITREGVNLKGISEAAEKIGFRTYGAKLTTDHLLTEVKPPCILHWNQEHFVVLPPQPKYVSRKKKILIADPASGLIQLTQEQFKKSWTGGREMGIALIFETTNHLFEAEDDISEKAGLKFLLSYTRPFKKYLVQIFLGMLLGSLLSLVFPFLTQNLVDLGINGRNLNFVYLILFGQLALFLGTTAIEIIRSWLLLHMSARINVSIISDFLIKLMKLPIKFFDAKLIGDISQRINDHTRIEQFLTGSSLNTLFSMINFIVFAVVLGIYSIPILLVFLFATALSVIWILVFMKKNKALDYERFKHLANNQSKLIEIISGMRDIKLNNGESSNRWEWERIQARLFKVSVQSLNLSQIQNVGSNFFVQLKNIFITFLAAKEVIDGQISLGMMLSITFVIGQMNGPINQLFQFLKNYQDAKISLERLSEIHTIPNEEHGNDESVFPELDSNKADSPAIEIKNVSFRYSGPSSPWVIKDLSLTIPYGKITAIVGSSGSGKTTLMKLLLKFYNPTEGTILIDGTDAEKISTKWWRNQCGVVLTDGYIFSNTVERNIAVEGDVNQERLQRSIEIANIKPFVDNLPLGVHTKLGNAGNGISSGQRQRLLIARAVYKNPKFIFLDEATNTLDANNEKTIMKNLNQFFKNRTVIIIAHRLSTVKSADQIIVLEDGKIAEVGNHDALSAKKGRYYELVKNQLELGQ
ncbi:MAG: peptidase domain-containing ABC transporter [Chitinophaga sp.]|uniref:peptidase domain-containing ABC transporter n=1 Tax=Chitinophaga sp. TaxID=1869181 RepID=UPI0025C1203C|nr:peptidase domain-containing ABC transporter [Chitinophaga sp.]MBV8252046.1 peptidase domain-containing ABC transporter [Chitinophaga sp.]